MSILITGSSGFVGSAVVRKIVEKNYTPIVVRRFNSENIESHSEIVIDSLDSKTDWNELLLECKVVIHCAARVHMMKDKSLDPLTEFREINTHGTLNLAKNAGIQGVKRFIFLSSIKVSGETTPFGHPFKSGDAPAPKDPYGISKLEAEEGLKIIARETGMELVIIRPPLIYGAGVKGNFGSLLKYASKGIPLPFGLIKNNKRSMVSIDTLVDLIVTCIEHPHAVNRVFLVSDGEDISTAKIFQQLSTSFGKSGFMLCIPVFLFKMVGMLTGKLDLVNRLCGNLQVDISDTKSILNWEPIVSVQDAFDKTAKHYLITKEG